MLITPGLSAAAINPARYLERVILTSRDALSYSVGFWDAADKATLFQDDAETLPVTASGQSVARMRDKFGWNHITFDAGQRPVYTEADGLAYLDCSAGTCAGYTATMDLGTQSQATLVCGLRKLSDATAQTLMAFGNAPATDVGSLLLQTPGVVGGAQLRFGARGADAQVFAAMVNLAAPVSGVAAGFVDFMSGSVSARWNGVDRATAPSAPGAALLGNEQLFVLANNNGASANFTGHWFGAVLRIGPTEARVRNAAEGYFALRTGVF